MAAAVRARALADTAVLDAVLGADTLERAQQALAIARELDEPALLARALTACGFIAGQGYSVEVARACFAEAIGAGSARSSPYRRWAPTPRATPSAYARPPRKGATSPTRSATGSTRVCVALASGRRRRLVAI